ncbi:MAG TPA: hypothetical protein VKI00_19415 [Mycobacterium sp.]|uniref:hypothetical protein n=1 Tax=Mycobacterium sp. TaxID=1785 RepID=UPI002BBC16A4|nr:hypothetical protein [Mycobacterium sp.]HME77738.1 hypothetical protein [Mycobacterium sp.]
MTTAREKVRTELILDIAAGGELPITQVDYYVKQQYPSASVLDVQNETLATIRSLADDGLIVLGAMSGDEGRWETWDGPLDNSIQKICDVYVTHYDDPPAWVFFAWMKLTDEGKRVAAHLEAGLSDDHRTRKSP